MEGQSPRQVPFRRTHVETAAPKGRVFRSSALPPAYAISEMTAVGTRRRFNSGFKPPTHLSRIMEAEVPSYTRSDNQSAKDAGSLGGTLPASPPSPPSCPPFAMAVSVRTIAHRSDTEQLVRVLLEPTSCRKTARERESYIEKSAGDSWALHASKTSRVPDRAIALGEPDLEPCQGMRLSDCQAAVHTRACQKNQIRAAPYQSTVCSCPPPFFCAAHDPKKPRSTPEQPQP